MNIAKLMLGDYIMLAELLGLWVMLESNVHLKKRTIRVTRAIILLIFLEAMLSIADRWAGSLDRLTAARIILTPTVYLLHPVIMLCIMDMAEFMTRRRFLMYLPIAVSAPLLYTSQWTHLIYWFSEDNRYIAAEGAMRYYPYLLFLFYLALFVGAFAVRYVRRGMDERKGVLISILAAVIGLVLNVALKARSITVRFSPHCCSFTISRCTF